MEDHHGDDHYGTMADLRHLISANPTPHFPPANLFSAAGRQNLPFEIMMSGRHNLMPPPLPLHDFVTTEHSRNTSSTTSGAGAGAGASTACGSAAISGSTSFFGGFEGDVGGTGRWPRQETLTLLDIRSRLDPKFKEANHKGPLWDEVSSIMSEEHGYQRSGKKCREKFENLYKYYKKTKEGKAGRQDGKHYRFFRQLEALYGDTTINMTNPPVVSTSSMSFHGMTQQNPQDHVFDSLSLSNSPGFETCSSSGEDDDGRKRRRRSWKSKVKDFIDAQMRKLMEKQELWLEKMMRAMEQKEQERVTREEQWRNEEAARMERERKKWAKERAWIESRDAALMEFLDKVNGRDPLKGSSPEAENDDNTEGSNNHWAEPEITRLIQLKSSLESRLNHTREGDEVLWEEIGAKMACYGYERSAAMCKEKWETINYYLVKKTKEECNKKRKEDYNNFHSNEGTNYSLYNQGQGRAYCEIINERGPDQTARIQPNSNNDGSSPSSSNAGNVVQDSCFRFLMGDGDHHGLWESYGLKLNNGENQ